MEPALDLIRGHDGNGRNVTLGSALHASIESELLREAPPKERYWRAIPTKPAEGPQPSTCSQP